MRTDGNRELHVSLRTCRWQRRRFWTQPH